VRRRFSVAPRSGNDQSEELAMPRARCLVALFVVACVGWLGMAGTPRSARVQAQPDVGVNPKALLEQRDRWSRESSEDTKQGKYAEALAAARQMLALEQKLFGELHDDVVGSLDRIAKLHELIEDFTAAKDVRQKVLAIQIKRFGPADWRTGD